MKKRIKVFTILLLILILVVVGIFFYIKPKFSNSSFTSENVKVIKLALSKKAFYNIRKKRKKALERGILLSETKDYVDANILINGLDNKAQIRLKGDWTDHIRDEKKWSFRVKMKGDGRFFGMKKFSLQHPYTRNFIHEWVFHELQKKLGMIALRYGFVKLILEVEGEETDLGIYAYEEAFHKLLIENNRRKEGVIIKFDETKLWEDRLRALEEPNGERRDFEEMFRSSTIKAFSEKSTLEDSVFRKQYEIAKDLINRYREGTLPAEKVFDLEKIGKQLAIINIFGAEHSVIWHNLRFYYNPITSLLEPVVFDVNGGRNINYQVGYHIIKNNSKLQFYRAKYLDSLTSSGYLESFFKSIKTELNNNIDILNLEFPKESFDTSSYFNNRDYILKTLNTSQLLKASFADYDDPTFTLHIKNVNSFNLQLESILFKGEVIASIIKPQTIKPFNNQLVQFNVKKGITNKDGSMRPFKLSKDYKNLKLKYKIVGSKIERKSDIHPVITMDTSFFKLNSFTYFHDLSQFDFIYQDREKRLITFQSGVWELDQNITLPSDYKITIPEGFKLNLKKNAKIISYSPVFMNGTINNPISIYSKDGSGQGIFVLNAKKKSNLDYVKFYNLSNPSTINWSITGAVTFYNSDVDLDHVTFNSFANSEDALNIIQSNFTLINCDFTDIKSDAFDGDFVKGEIKNCTFNKIGNDAIDVSGSNMSLYNINISNTGDKAISAGEKSVVNGNNILIKDCEIGITSKDLSSIRIDTLELKKCKLGITSFQKKPEFGPAKISIKNGNLELVGTPYLVQKNSKLLLNNKETQTVENVQSRLYGKDFGKKSK